MSLVTISRYAESISDPHGLFRTLGEPVCERDVYGDPIFISGGNAAVFKVTIEGRQCAVKCHMQPKPRTKLICDYLSGIDSDIIYKTTYLPEELYVYDLDGSGQWCDVILMEWINGKTLEYEVAKAMHYGDTARLEELAHEFDSMSLKLLEQPWAHGDVKPGNIIIGNDGKMRLIDYDAVYIPSLQGEKAQEIGTPPYQHPARDSEMYDKSIDDYSIALISSFLHTISARPELYLKHNRKNACLFSSADILAGRSIPYKLSKECAASSGNSALYKLLCLLDSSTPNIDGLADIFRFMTNGTGKLTGPSERSIDTDRICMANRADNTVPAPELFVSKGAWGYRHGGLLLIPPLFDSALEFSDGMAAVNIGGFNHYIDCSGRTVINCSEYESIKSFSAGFAPIKKGGLWGYIDKAGKEIVAPQYIYAETPRNGTATVKTINNKTICILPE